MFACVNVLLLMSSVFCNIGDVELKMVVLLNCNKFICLKTEVDFVFYDVIFRL